MSYVNCTLCPRQCGANRTAGEFGFCRCPDTALVAKIMRHFWEEPALAGSGGSGAIFFGGCTLGCKFCQNAAISAGPVGTKASSADLRRYMEQLIAEGAETEEEVAMLQVQGVDRVQGYALAKPMPVVQLKNFYRMHPLTRRREE